MKAADHVFELHYNAALLAHRQGDLQEAVSQVRCWLQLAAALHADACGGAHVLSTCLSGRAVIQCVTITV